MKVCLIKIPTFEAPKSLSYFGSVPNLGLAYIAASTREAGHAVQVIDAPGEAITNYEVYETSVGQFHLHGLRMDEIVDRIDDDVDVVGLTNMFLHEWKYIEELLPKIKQQLPGAVTILGGENATAWSEQMLEACEALDLCVMGEGDEAVVKLLEVLEQDGDLSRAPSIAYRNNGVVCKTERLPRIKQVDELPWPAWDLFPVEAYLDSNLGSGVDLGRSINMLSSRGCPYQCTFCSSPEMWTTRYSARKPENVVDEIQYYIERYGITNVNFNDLTAVLTKKWIMAFCNVIQSRGIQITWQLPSGTRSEVIDREAADLLYASGCRNFCYAPESGSVKILKEVKKKIKIPSLLKSLKGALDAGINCQASIIIGFPQETLANLWDTYKLIIRMAWKGLHTLSVMIFAPYPGSEYYHELYKEGKLEFNDKYIYSTILRSGATAKTFNRKYGTRTLIFIQFFFLVSFYSLQYLIRPFRVVQIIKNLKKNKQENVMEQFLTAKYRQFSGKKEASA